MEIVGLPIQTLYLYILIISGSLTLLYLLFGDMVDGIFEAVPLFNVALIFPFFTIFSASGYLLEAASSFSTVLIAILSFVVALILVILLHLFILVPLRSAEESLVFTEESLRGRIGKVIVSIPEDGFGEVIIEGVSGTISKPAFSYRNVPISSDTKVLIIEAEKGNVAVVPYEA
ncbi:hypothetical protein [Metabacillus iocasae]|uniref:Membrane-bound ClpP family serine protease n=1 Tax=Priestia iocasae TaxID=2291674 RepID=A0ABS2QX55_9BACI|nr:hypothetical protein [Metabacillus iocasae]MBM7703985.1 membrane-bound ClpP family serine protease [Metabacillus iocasae]